MQNNITAVIRSIGERTTGLCRYILAKELPEKNIFIVSRAPSTEGTRAVYETGLSEGRKWTLFVDADQLLLPGAVEFLYNMAEYQAIPAFGVKGTVKDKLFMELRGKGCGPILYHTEAFEKAINYIPDPYERIRPDSHIINQMKKNHSYEWVRSEQNVAYHDYEQFYQDIYKKMFINANKMTYKCTPLLGRWEKLSKKDSDFSVVLQGYHAGRDYNGPLAIDYTMDYGYQPSFEEKENIESKDYEKILERLKQC